MPSLGTQPFLAMAQYPDLCVHQTHRSTKMIPAVVYDSMVFKIFSSDFVHFIHVFDEVYSPNFR